MTSISNIHKPIRDKLAAFLRENNVPHLLFYGPHGSGKKTIVNNGAGRVNFFTGGLKKDNTPKRKKYLGVVVK